FHFIVKGKGRLGVKITQNIHLFFDFPWLLDDVIDVLQPAVIEQVSRQLSAALSAAGAVEKVIEIDGDLLVKIKIASVAVIDIGGIVVSEAMVVGHHLDETVGPELGQFITEYAVKYLVGFKQGPNSFSGIV